MNVDAAFFLRLRTRFIGRYYSTGVGPFREIQRKIDAEESPYDEPPPSFDPEYGEPAFLEEWIEADDAAQVVGTVCRVAPVRRPQTVLQGLGTAIGVSPERGRQSDREEGRVPVGLQAARLERFSKPTGHDCPVRFDVIEQIVLARNRAQHGEHLSILGARHDPKTLTKHRDLIFASEGELRMWVDDGAAPDTWLAPRLEITQESLGAAITEVEKLADWIEARIPDVWARRHGRVKQDPESSP